MLLQGATLPLFGVLLALLISEARGNSLANKLQVGASWKALDFAFDCEEDRQTAINQKYFIPGNSLPIDIDVHFTNGTEKRVFITIPRVLPGIPVTLGYLSKNRSSDGSFLIAPYPNWEWQQLNDCNNSLISVYRIQVDRCNRLWVVDSGQLGRTQVCPPKLLTFSLETNELISKYVFPNGVLNAFSLLLTPIVDTRGKKCENTFVYVADIRGFGLVVYDHQRLCSWRVRSNLLYPYPDRATFKIQEIEFDRMEGIVSGALTPLYSDGDRWLLFHSLSSRTESYVRTSVIRNESIFENNSNASPRSFIPFKKTRSSQSVAEATDMNGVLYFGLLGKAAIACWNSEFLDYGTNSIEKIAVNSKTLQFPMAIKVIREPDGREVLVVLENSFQRYVAGTLNPNEINFRILAGFTSELIRGTKCDRAYRTGPL